MDNGACLYYKLTYEPKGSGELKMWGMKNHFDISGSIEIR